MDDVVVERVLSRALACARRELDVLSKQAILEMSCTGKVSPVSQSVLVDARELAYALAALIESRR